ncbi:RrF2 family transcriptional regulator [Treponema primitia]|uniref:RrF2 family transcriptional regulator n=1 Tax=Treponema primitia TaxID=88058 RepID=UPI00025554B7|nr:Rrf2 family transcriptional regulator [Treponema primitia]
MAYSTEFSRAISIGILINIKMEEFGFEYVSTKVLANHLKIPVPTVVRILKSLNAAGITTTKEGSKGGVLLAKPIAKITLLDIFLALEHGHLFKTEMNFIVEDPRSEHFKEVLMGCMQDAEDAMKQSLAKTTLADIANDIG